MTTATYDPHRRVIHLIENERPLCGKDPEGLVEVGAYADVAMTCPPCERAQAASQAAATRPNCRAAKAELLATTGPSWIRCHLRTGGKAYAIESTSRPGRYHLVNCQACTCEDFRHRSQPCFHVLAVQRYVAAVKAEQANRSQPATDLVDLEAERTRRLAAQYDALVGEAA